MPLLSTDSVHQFLNEAQEILDSFSLHLAAFEKDQHTPETLNSIYREMHTLKGTAQLFGFAQIALVAHSIETCLNPVRNGTTNLSPELLDTIYLASDIIRNLVSFLREHKTEPTEDQTALQIIPRLAECTCVLMNGSLSMQKDVLIHNDDPLSDRESAKAAMDLQESPGPLIEPLLQAIPKPTIPDGKKPAMTENETNETAEKIAVSKSESDLNSETIRVQVGLLDNLMNLIGELVLIRNQVVQYTNTSNEAEFTNLSQRLNTVTTALQSEVMKTRMQPIGNILSKFQRIVRDMSRELEKEIELKIEGNETELDKTLIEAVKDPLTHIVRNSVDHGIESPADRDQAGKSPIGQILIRSYHEGGQVVVEISDDGRGLSRTRIGKKALEKGLVTASDLEKLSDREVNALIFAPGFSTAEKVSNISGRGVGMDIVKTNIEKIGGVIELNSVDGAGMTIRLKIPLTLAIVPALVIRSGTERFTIPQVKLVELVRVDKQDQSTNEIQMLQGQPVFKLRGNLLPLLSLNQLLKIEDSSDTLSPDVTNVAVLAADSGQFGLIVDKIEDSTDIVVKPLNNLLKSLKIYSGATVLGDGAVALVLDVVGLAAHANIFDEKTGNGKSLRDQNRADKISDDITEYLVIDVGATGCYTIPLCLVNRLEEFRADEIEHSGDQRVVRYRDSILPIISVPEKLDLKMRAVSSAAEKRNTIPIVVIERAGRHFGLEVKDIIDVIAINAAIDGSVRDRPCILGSSIHNGAIIVVIDVYKIIESHIGVQSDGNESNSRSAINASKSDRGAHHILHVEDNAFFRKHVAQILVNAGYTVSSEINGEEGFRRLEDRSSPKFSMVLSDIEMPIMNGYQLAAKIRSQPAYADLPLIALTTKTRDTDVQKGLKAGFGRVLEKLNAEQLIHEIDTLLLKGATRHAA